MAKFGSGSGLVFLIDGYDFLASKLKTLNLKIGSMTEQSDGLNDNFEAYTPVGKQSAMITQGGGFFDTASKNIHDAMAANMGTLPTSTPRVACCAFAGNTAGAVAYGLAAIFSVAYEAALELSKLTKANAEHLLDGLVERGQVVCPLGAQTATFDTTGTPVDYTADPSQYVTPIASNTLANPTVVTTPVPHGLTTGQKILISGSNSTPSINGDLAVTVISPTTFSVAVNVTVAGTAGSFVRSSTVNGASGYQQVTSFSGFTGYVGKLRHSADNVTYVDLVTFTNVTTSQKAERVTAAGTINRYLVYVGTVSGSGSVSPFAMIARS